jgi:hypothetical protein
MTYKKNKPDSGKAPNIDAPNIQGNFASFDTVFGSNHLSMNDPLQHQGDHSTIIFQSITGSPGKVFNSALLFARDATSNVGTQPQLSVKIPQFLPNEIPNTPMQLTYNQVNIAGPQYQSFLIGGYLIFMGSLTGTAVKNTPIATPVNLSPAPTKILIAIATPNTFTTDSTPQPYTASTTIVSNSQFTINSTTNGSHTSGQAFSFTWVAIGTV